MGFEEGRASCRKYQGPAQRLIDGWMDLNMWMNGLIG